MPLISQDTHKVTYVFLFIAFMFLFISSRAASSVDRGDIAVKIYFLYY